MPKHTKTTTAPAPKAVATTTTTTAQAPAITDPVRRLGLYLNYLRRDAGIDNQSAFARKLGITVSCLANIETGRTPIKLQAAWEACRLLGIHPDYLISRGARNPGPFPQLDPNESARVESIITASATLNFQEAWGAVRDAVFPYKAQEIDMEPDPETKDLLRRTLLRVSRIMKQPGAMDGFDATMRELKKRL